MMQALGDVFVVVYDPVQFNRFLPVRVSVPWAVPLLTMPRALLGVGRTLQAAEAFASQQAGHTCRFVERSAGHFAAEGDAAWARRPWDPEDHPDFALVHPYVIVRLPAVTV